MRRAVILILSCLALSGCVPVRFGTPPVRGVLEKDGKPVVGAMVRTSWGARSSTKVFTDAEGRFRTEAMSQLTVAVAVSDFESFVLEVFYAGERYVTRAPSSFKEDGVDAACQIPDPLGKEVRDAFDGQDREVELRPLSCRWTD